MQSLEPRLTLDAAGLSPWAVVGPADTVAPEVRSVTPPESRIYAAGKTLSFKVNFTERVVVTGTPTLPITIGDVVRQAVWNGKGSGRKSLTFTTVVQDGDLAPTGVQVAGPIGLANGAAIRDRAGNAVLPAVTATFPEARVDAVGPSVTEFGPVTITGGIVSLRVTFDEAVRVAGKPSIPFTFAGSPKNLVYARGSGRNVLTFRSRAATPEQPAVGNVSLSSSAIVLGSGRITDTAGNAAISLTNPDDAVLPGIRLTVSPGSVDEDGTSNLVYTFTRPRTARALTVNYTVGGTAVFNTDYTVSGSAGFSATTGSVVFAAGAATARVTIDPIGDVTPEPSETVVLTLAAGAGYTIDTPAAITGTIVDDDADEVPAVELQPRGGLPNFFAKAGGGGEVRVAYLGGSITAAPGWRVKSLAWLEGRFPQARFVEINATIGGTGSDLGAYRVGQDVIAGNPDLVFVEFAVNDGWAPPAQIMATMEGIVRQVRRANPAADICFVYTLSEPDVPDLVAGRCQRSAVAMEAVADRYRIPSVHFGVEVARRLAAGTLVFKGPLPEPFDPAAMPQLFSADGVHPLLDTGHVLYADVLTRSLAQLEKLGTPAAPHAPIPPLRPDNWEAATLVPITQSMLRGAWRRVTPADDSLARTFASQMPVLWKAEQPGAALVLRVQVPEAPGVRARRVAIYDLLGPGGGVVSVRIDGGAAKRVARIDGYCTYWRLATLGLGDLEPGEHEIEITLTGDVPDKRAILFESNRGDFDSHPEKYAPHVWYASAALTFSGLTS